MNRNLEEPTINKVLRGAGLFVFCALGLLLAGLLLDTLLSNFDRAALKTLAVVALLGLIVAPALSSWLTGKTLEHFLDKYNTPGSAPLVTSAPVVQSLAHNLFEQGTDPRSVISPVNLSEPEAEAFLSKLNATGK